MRGLGGRSGCNGLEPIVLYNLAAMTLAAVTLAAVTLAAVTLAAVAPAAVTLAAVTLAAGTLAAVTLAAVTLATETPGCRDGTFSIPAALSRLLPQASALKIDTFGKDLK